MDLRNSGGWKRQKNVKISLRLLIGNEETERKKPIDKSNGKILQILIKDNKNIKQKLHVNISGLN